MNKKLQVLIVGSGLAGPEAAYFLATKGVRIVLADCKKIVPNPAQKLTGPAELVCTNSLKSLDETSPHGMLKFEMEKLGSLILKAGHATRVPAGEALAVDREQFSQYVQNELQKFSNIKFIDEEITDVELALKKHECHYAIIAAGPLLTLNLEDWIKKIIGNDDFYFYDAIAPVVDADTLDMSKLYYKGRFDKNQELPQGPSEDEEEELDSLSDESVGDYLNAPMNKDQYVAFINELKNAEKVPPKNFEEAKFFESCLPIDLMAERGEETARYSCMKPLGLELPDGKRPYAVVQLRKENLLGSAFNLVGFQTRLTYKEQVRIFKMIPGLEQASFLHLGSVHRNSFINSGKHLNETLSLKSKPHIYFAGQMTGVEGYTESASSGLYAALQLWQAINNRPAIVFPRETAIGALINYIMTFTERPTPSNINSGLFPPINIELLSKEDRKRKNRKRAKRSVIAKRAQKSFLEFVAPHL